MFQVKNDIILKRNLIYHFSGIDNPVLDMHFDILKGYKDVFNGDIIFSIAYIDDINSVSRIIEFIKTTFKNADIVMTPNHETRELKPFKDYLLPKIIRSSGMTLFGHSKGISTYNNPNTRSSILWAKALYKTNLSNIEMINKKMNHHVFGGGILIPEPHGSIKVGFHYPGTYFWFNNEKLSKLNYMNMLNTRHGVEAYPAIQTTIKDVTFFTSALQRKHYNLYDYNVWLEVASTLGVDL